MYGYRNQQRNYNFNAHVLGVMSLSFRSLSKLQLVSVFVLSLLVNVGVLFGAAHLFQTFWVWYMPVWWAGAPVLDYWHSFATVVILLVVMHTLKPNKV